MAIRKSIRRRGEAGSAEARKAGSAPKRAVSSTKPASLLGAVIIIAAAATAADPALFVNGLLLEAFPAPAARAQDEAPDLATLIDGIPGWVRTGEVRTFAKETLYGHIDGGAEIVLQYGFRRLVVIEFLSEVQLEEPGPRLLQAQAPVSADRPPACLAFQEPKELTLEFYEMESGEAAFGLYSTKVDGGETASERISATHWLSPGQANLVKGPILVNILAPDLTAEEIEVIAAVLEPKIPGRGTARPPGVEWLPKEGMVPGSERYIKGEPAAMVESPLLERAFWGFGSQGTVAFSAKYGPFPSRVVVVDFGGERGDFGDLVLGLFREYLSDVRKDDRGVVEGRSPVGHWFLFAQDKATGRFAALVLGEPDEATARARLKEALQNVSSKEQPPSSFPHR
jgi:hypothetical protein